MGVLLFVLLPLFVYKIYPPELKSSPDVPSLGPERNQKNGPGQLQRNFDGAACVGRPGPLDLWSGLHQRYHRRAVGAVVDGK